MPKNEMMWAVMRERGLNITTLATYAKVDRRTVWSYLYLQKKVYSIDGKINKALKKIIDALGARFEDVMPLSYRCNTIRRMRTHNWKNTKLVEKIRASGLNISRLSKQTGLGRNTIRIYLNSDRIPYKNRILGVLMDFFDAPLEDLFLPGMIDPKRGLYINSVLWKAMRDRGLYDARELASAIGLSLDTPLKWLRLKRFPYKRTGDIGKGAQKLIDFFNLPLEALFPKNALQKGFSERTVVCVNGIHLNPKKDSWGSCIECLKATRQKYADEHREQIRIKVKKLSAKYVIKMTPSYLGGLWGVPAAFVRNYPQERVEAYRAVLTVKRKMKEIINEASEK